MERFRLLIDGALEDGAATFESRDPFTGETWALMSEAREAEVDRAVRAAHRAGPGWAGMTATARGRLLWTLAERVAEAAPRLAALETRDTGKIIRETRAQVAYVADYWRYYAGLADKIEGAHLPIDKPDMEAWTRREPVGVVAAVVPWNSQLFLAAVKLGPALAAGCTVVLKASEEGPAPLLAFAEIAADVLPPGVLNVVTGFGATCGRALTSHPLVARVAFTGGPETGRAVLRNTAENLATASLELGGKSPFLAFADADLDSAANAQVAGVFAATGQSCVAGSRLFVERGVKDAFLARLKAKAEAIRVGDPSDMTTEMGPLCTAAQKERMARLIAESVDAGARLVTGGAEGRGLFVRHTILDCDETSDAPALGEEAFGPLLAARSFGTEAEALHLANDSPYGFAAGVFTRDLARAHRMARGLKAGVVWLNTYRAVSPLAPFGGHSLSGQGREGGLAGALDYTTTKTVWLRTSEEPIPDPFVMR